MKRAGMKMKQIFSERSGYPSCNIRKWTGYDRQTECIMKGRQIRLKKRKRRIRLKIFLIAAILCMGVSGVSIYQSRTYAIPPYAESMEIRESAGWQKVFSEGDIYPESLRNALKKNSELLNFVLGYPYAGTEARGGIHFWERLEKCPLFLQWDARWGYVPYGTSVIGVSGCGPTCLSMVIYSLTRDRSATPDKLAARAMEEGYYVRDVGTAWSFMADIVSDYGISVSQFTCLEEAELKDRLDDGNLVICSMGPGAFTDQGHFIVIRDYSENGLLVNDPFSRMNSSKAWTYDTLSTQCRQMWVYSS